MRDDRKWTALTPNSLVIKQAIMRALKYNAGQKRSTGFKKTQRGI